jgi:hypothetical protein
LQLRGWQKKTCKPQFEKSVIAVIATAIFSLSLFTIIGTVVQLYSIVLSKRLTRTLMYSMSEIVSNTVF